MDNIELLSYLLNQKQRILAQRPISPVAGMRESAARCIRHAAEEVDRDIRQIQQQVMQ